MSNLLSPRGWRKRQELARIRGVVTPEQAFIKAQRNAIYLGLPVPTQPERCDVTGFESLLTTTDGPVHAPATPAETAVETAVATTVVPEPAPAAEPAAVPVVSAAVDNGAATSLEDALAELEPAKPATKTTTRAAAPTAPARGRKAAK